jgi:hypothetical protein
VRHVGQKVILHAICTKQLGRKSLELARSLS